ncbi:hypothetical protein [Streptococcus sp. DD12]|uniref:hypothetical protein n=1 Tax=Streptococcus sp. DD12 TaxID=1777880 RepID=UPI00079372B6|nr:hypothetical protein [Streptococcus sp. DD12]KXT75345.1 hypothetical protein STRDD12_01466 [Streptococcus sp. DD12]
MTKKEWLVAFKNYYGRKPNKDEQLRGLLAGQYTLPPRKSLGMKRNHLITLLVGLVLVLILGVGATATYRYQSGCIRGQWQATTLTKSLSAELESELKQETEYYNYYKAFSNGNSFYTNQAVTLKATGHKVEAQVTYSVDRLALYSAMSSVVSSAYGVTADELDTVLPYDDFVKSLDNSMKKQAKEAGARYDSKTATVTASLFTARVAPFRHSWHVTEVNDKLYRAYFSKALTLRSGKDMPYQLSGKTLTLDKKIIFSQIKK